MTRESFEAGLTRLKSQWPSAYGKERADRVWGYVQHYSDKRFEEIVARALDTMRSAPLPSDFVRLNDDLDWVAKRRAAGETVLHMVPKTALDKLSSDNRSADREFVEACIKLLQDKEKKNLTTEQFEEGCRALEQMANMLNPRDRVVPFKGQPHGRPYRDD